MRAFKGHDGARRGRAKRPRGGHGQLRTVLACTAVGLLLALPVPFANTAIGYVPVMAYLLVLVLSNLYLRILRKRLSFEERCADSACQRGDRLPFSIVVSNGSVLPAVSVSVQFFVSDLFGGERENTMRRISLPPRSCKTYEFAVSFDHIGSYTAGVKRIDVSDPFGIFRYAKVNEELPRVSVRPRLYEAASIEVSTESAQESKRPLTTVIDDGMDYCGVREYRWGDPIKSIHWKLSARTDYDDYFTRLFETTCNPGVEIFVDCDAPDYGTGALMDAYDALLEAALSIERWASTRAYETALAFVDAGGGRRRFEGPLSARHEEVLERLPRISEGDGRALVEFVQSEAASVYAPSNFIVCTCGVTDELVGELLRVRGGRRRPMLFAIVPPGADTAQEKRMAARLNRLVLAGVACRVLSEARELEEVG